MLAVQFTIAESAKKTAARVARQAGLFLRMIKAAGFAIDQQRIGVTPLDSGTEKGWENFHLQKAAALAARSQIGSIE
jgi:hypothetical protein